MPVQTLTCILSFCCKSGSNRKTQPCYWLATNTRRKLNKNTIEETEHTARTAGENIELNTQQVGLQETPHLQDSIKDHSEYSKC
jgi:hypothetical protein